MPPLLQPLAQSESKMRFFERLGLDERNENHKRLYSMMKEEAIEGRKRVTASIESLAPQFRNDPSIEPPYKNAQISEPAMHREVLRIYETARPETRKMYEFGQDLDGPVEENWIIRWMLWHVFRYRDSRNKSRRVRSASESSGEHSSDARSTVPLTDGVVNAASANRFYDPVRDS